MPRIEDHSPIMGMDKRIESTTRGPLTLTLCLTTVVGMTNGNVLQTCIKYSLHTALLQTKTIEI